jgi:hypothetical protein
MLFAETIERGDVISHERKIDPSFPRRRLIATMNMRVAMISAVYPDDYLPCARDLQFTNSSH